MPPADAPSLPLAEVDAALDRLTATTGPRSVQRRAAELRGLFAATDDEQRFLAGERTTTGKAWTCQTLRHVLCRARNAGLVEHDAD